MKILVSGDWHFGLTVGGYDYHDDIVRAVQCIIEATDSVDLFVHLGDMFHDSRPTPRSIATVIGLIDNLHVPSVFLVGNHDVGRGSYTSYETKEGSEPLRIPMPDALEPLRKIRFRCETFFPPFPMVHAVGDNLFLFAGYVTDSLAQHLYGWKSAQEMVDSAFYEASKEEDRIKAGFCHLDVDGAVLGSEIAVMRGGKLNIPKAIAKSLPFEIFDGHIHKRQKVEPNIWLPGSIVATDFSDVDGDLGYAIVEV